MKYIFSIIFLFLLFSCKMKYTTQPNDPYRIFTKNGYSGLINTDTKEIIIPSKYYSIQTYLIDDNNRFYECADKNSNTFLFNINGNLIYSFSEGEFLKNVFIYNRKTYILTNTPSESNKKNVWEEIQFTDNHKLFRINRNEKKLLLNYPTIKINNFKNIVYFSNEIYDIFNQSFDEIQKGFFDLNTDNKIVIKDFDNAFYRNHYIPNKNEIWIQERDSQTKKINQYYDKVLDSTLTFKTNPIKNVKEIYPNYYIIETVKGFQASDFNEKLTSFNFPYLVPLLYHSISYSNDSFNRKENFNDLFVFSNEMQSNESGFGGNLGIIDFSGKILIPADYNKLNIPYIYYQQTPSDEFRKFVFENKLNNYYFLTRKNISNNKAEYSIFNEEGNLILKTIGKIDDDYYTRFDITSKEPKINFYLNDSTRTFNLKTKELIDIKKGRINY